MATLFDEELRRIEAAFAELESLQPLPVPEAESEPAEAAVSQPEEPTSSEIHAASEPEPSEPDENEQTVSAVQHLLNLGILGDEDSNEAPPAAADESSEDESSQDVESLLTLGTFDWQGLDDDQEQPAEAAATEPTETLMERSPTSEAAEPVGDFTVGGFDWDALESDPQEQSVEVFSPSAEEADEIQFDDSADDQRGVNQHTVGHFMLHDFQDDEDPLEKLDRQPRSIAPRTSGDVEALQSLENFDWEMLDGETESGESLSDHLGLSPLQSSSSIFDEPDSSEEPEPLDEIDPPTNWTAGDLFNQFGE